VEQGRAQLEKSYQQVAYKTTLTWPSLQMQKR